MALASLLSTGVNLDSPSSAWKAASHLRTKPFAHSVNSGVVRVSDDDLIGLIKQHPELVADLVHSSNEDLETAERVLRLPHKPSTQIANKVSLWRSRLSPFAVEYVMKHGGKVALRNLLQRQYVWMPVRDVLSVQEIVLRKHRELVVLGDRVHHFGVAGLLRQGRRLFIQQCVQFLSEVTDAHTKLKSFDRVRSEIIHSATMIGVPVPEDLLQPGETYMTAEQILESQLEHRDNVPYGYRYHTLLNWNVEYLNLFRNLPLEDQRTVYVENESWTLLNYSKDPHNLYSLTTPRALAGDIPTYRTLRAIPVKSFWPPGQETSVSVLFRMFENEFGDCEDSWSLFENLYGEWDGTFGELVDTITSVH